MRAHTKTLLRSIKGSLGRFLAIAGISALGCGFFAGIQTTAPDMRQAAESYYQTALLQSASIISTKGFSSTDVVRVQSLLPEAQVEGVVSTDTLLSINQSTYTIRLSNVPSTINVPSVREGRLPQEADEIALSLSAQQRLGLKLGDTIELSQTTSEPYLSTHTYNVVGFVDSPLYLFSQNLGSTTLGSGTVDTYGFVSKESFVTSNLYTTLAVQSDALTPDQVATTLEQAIDTLKQGRLYDLKTKAQDELDEKRQEFEHSKEDALQQLSDAQDELDEARKKLDASWTTYRQGTAQLAQGKDDLARQRQKTLSDLDAQERDLLAQQQALADGLSQVRAGLETVQTNLEPLEQAKSALPADQFEAQYGSNYEQLLAQQVQLKEQQASLQEQQSALESGLQTISAGRQEALDKLSAAEQTLQNKQQELIDAKATLQQGEADYQKGLEEFETQRTDTESQLNEAEQKLIDGQQTIDNLETPEVFVLEQDDNVGIAMYEADATRIATIAHIFPVLFFLVAALVILTTMTRMVEEDRTQLGLLKALGYSSLAIAKNYLWYALSATGVGAVVGIAFLTQLLPATIMKGYASIYAVPLPSLPLTVDLPSAGMALIAGLLVALVSTSVALAASFVEVPAQLLLPKAPKAGKRIVLEHVKPLWSRLNFSNKVMFRNLFRYKRRLFMTLAGIAGCTALMLVGFGLNDSLSDVLSKHYSEIVHYDAVLTGDADQLKDRSLIPDDVQVLAAAQTDARTIRAQTDTSQSTSTNKSLSTTLIIPEDVAAFAQTTTLRNRTTHQTVPLTDQSVILSEKLAEQLQVKVGSTITLFEQNLVGGAVGEPMVLTVSGIAEFYINSEVIVGPDAWKEAGGSAPVMDTLFVTGSTEALDELHISDVTVERIAQARQQFDSNLSVVKMVVAILIVAAAALAAIVLFNITNISLGERVREIATLKVLGFTPYEVDSYLFREILVASALGSLIGLVVGTYFEAYLLSAVELDYLMFSRDIHVLSYVIACGLTLVFSACMCWLMRSKLHAINMVESLKRVD